VSVRGAITLLLVLSASTPAPGASQRDAPDAIAIVVGSASPIRDVTVDALRDLYLRRQRLWPDGSRAMPVNLPADDPLRRTFSRRVLGRLPGELVGYWNQRYFEGIRPPLVLRSPQAICAYLATEPAGVGYVPADQVDGVACRVVRLLPAGAP
jgi:hypothetical protein